MTYQNIADRLRERSPVPLFAVRVWDNGVDAALHEATPETLFDGRPIRDAAAAVCVIAGLHLWNDNFAAAHNLCQGVATATGSYWHGLCHRREGHEGDGLAGNLRNAKYWFRQTGPHPAFEPVYRSTLSLLDNAGTGFRWATEAAGMLRAAQQWDPNAVIDWFAQAEAGTLSAESRSVLEEIQWREIDLLVDWCAREAVQPMA